MAYNIKASYGTWDKSFSNFGGLQQLVLLWINAMDILPFVKEQVAPRYYIKTFEVKRVQDIPGVTLVHSGNPNKFDEAAVVIVKNLDGEYLFTLYPEYDRDTRQWKMRDRYTFHQTLRLYMSSVAQHIQRKADALELKIDDSKVPT